MRRALFLFAGICLLATTGCAGAPPVSPDWQQEAGTQVLRMRWVKPLYPSLPNFFIPELVEEHDRFDPVETSSAGYDTDRRRAFVGSSTGGLYCLSLDRGQTIWRFNLDDPVGSAPIYDKGRKYVFFGADDGLFYALHARSGRKIWTTDTGAEIRRQSILFDDTLYVINADNTVFAMDPNNGEVIWQYRRPPVEGFLSSGHAGITIHNGHILTGFGDGFVAAIDAVAGQLVWSHDLASEVSNSIKDERVTLVDSDATPVVAKDILVAASVAGGLQGLEVDTGTVRWTRPEITGVTGLAEDNGMIFAARSSYGLTAIDPADGRVIWSKQFPTGVLQDPVVHDNLLLISDSEFGLYVISAFNGELLQRVDQREGFFAQPSIKNGYMLVLGNNGTLYAMSVL